MSSAEKQPDKCPIDHTARAKWLEQAQQSSGSSPPPAPSSSASSPIPFPHDVHRQIKIRPLALDREVSTIPRSDPAAPTTTPNTTSRSPNAEESSSQDVRSGNWIYPSEKMFFEAMRRKNHSPHATDMATIVPIHNAVNERAWKEIKEWESRFGWSQQANTRCGGPKLHSFSGDSKKLSPKARLNGLLGYQAPFDRHDWVVERCPGEPMVEYVIDFYSGRDDGKGKGLNFYLDVRPKLNSWEGWRMRAARMFGW
jgi:cytochrome c heme-lyase